jgi:hypothetical protein
MYPRGSIVFRVIAGLLIVGLLLALGVAVYRAGFTQGVLQATASAGGQNPQVGPGYPYYPGLFWPRFGFGFFPFFPLFGFFFFGLLIFFLFRALFRPWHWGYPGYWRGAPPAGGPPPWERERRPGEPEPEGQSQPDDSQQGQR